MIRQENLIKYLDRGRFCENFKVFKEIATSNYQKCILNPLSPFTVHIPHTPPHQHLFACKNFVFIVEAVMLTKNIIFYCINFNIFLLDEKKVLHKWNSVFFEW